MGSPPFDIRAMAAVAARLGGALQAFLSSADARRLWPQTLAAASNLEAAMSQEDILGARDPGGAPGQLFTPAARTHPKYIPA